MPDSPCVLVADDSRLTRWAVVRALTAEGFDVQAASTRDELLEFLLQRRVAVLVTASHLGGRAVTGLLARVSHACPTTRIVVLCNTEDRESVRNACAGAALVDKPFSIADVVAEALHTETTVHDEPRRGGSPTHG